jgi:DNA-binding transcriptional LysR family regulator
MEIRNLKAFLLLARSLSFTKSAEQMFLSQSAFSRQIVRLEEELGCQLFMRTKRNVELTNFGKTFLGHAEKIVSEYNKCIYNFDLSNSEEGYLRLGLLNDLIDEMFPKLINNFLKENPEVDVTYSDNGMSGLINNLLRDEIDCAYTLSPHTEKITDISSHTILSQPLYVAMSYDNPLSSRESLRMEDLSGCAFVVIMPDTYNLGMIHNNYLCKNAGFSPNVAAAVSNINSLMMLVNSNIGVAIVAETAKYIAPKGVKLLPIEPNDSNQHDLESVITILWKTSNTNPSIQKFIESTKKSLMDKMTL